MSEKMLMDGRNDERNGDDQEVREEVLKTKYFSKLGDMAQSKKIAYIRLGGHKKSCSMTLTRFSESDCPAYLRGGECVTDLKGNLPDSTHPG